jgi:hypothetical protein
MKSWPRNYFSINQLVIRTREQLTLVIVRIKPHYCTFSFRPIVIRKL